MVGFNVAFYFHIHDHGDLNFKFTILDHKKKTPKTQSDSFPRKRIISTRISPRIEGLPLTGIDDLIYGLFGQACVSQRGFSLKGE